MNTDIDLGDLVRDKITGVTGIVVVMGFWIYGGVRVGIQVEKPKAGVPDETRNFDLDQLAVVKKQVRMPIAGVAALVAARVTGGPARENDVPRAAP